MDASKFFLSAAIEIADRGNGIDAHEQIFYHLANVAPYDRCAAEFFEGLPVIEIIKAGAAGG